MRRVLSLVIAVVMLLSLASCSEKGVGKGISYTLDKSPQTLDPQYSGTTNALVVINNIYEGLVRLDEKGGVIPGIAESWEISPDGLTYTFNLKEGTRWKCPNVIKNHYGEEFYNRFENEVRITAHDFVFAMQRAISPQTNSPMAHRLFAISNATEIYSGQADVSSLGVTASDDHTLVVTLREPCDDMLKRFTEAVFMPCNEEFFNATGGRYGLAQRYILCNGPFYVTSWDSTSALVIKKNSEYLFADKVVPSGVTFTFESDDKKVANKIEAGSLAAALLPPDCEIPEDAVVVKENSNTVFGMAFNCSDSFMKNGNIRVALCESTDRSLFPASGISGEIQNGFVPKSCSAGSLNYRLAVGSQTAELKFNKESAAEKWQKGLSELGKNKVELTVICPERLETSVKHQIQIWQQVLGISLSVKLEIKSSEEIEAAVSKGEYQIALTSVESAYDSAVDFIADFRDGGIFRFDSTDFDLVVDKLLQVESDSDLLGGCFTAEHYILQHGIFFPLYSRSSRFVTLEDIEGIVIGESENTVSFIGAKRYD